MQYMTEVMVASQGFLVDDECTVELVRVPSGAGFIAVAVMKPTTNAKPTDQTPGYLWIHGGGYALGGIRMLFDSRAADMARKHGCVVVCPEYHLAEDMPYPAALNDCYATLGWMVKNAELLGINDEQIFVGGESAGGGLTAALCMLARDRGEYAIAYQTPLYPMLDNRDTETSANNFGGVWNTDLNHWAWGKYLAAVDRDAVDDMPPYAVPARQTDYAGLPPAYTFVGTIEPFYAEVCIFVENLRAAGVEVGFDVYEGCNHAFDLADPTAPQAQAAIAAFEEHYLYAVEHYRASQPGK